MKGSPDRAQGQSGLVTGKLKEELKTLALSAAHAGLAMCEGPDPNAAVDSRRELAFFGVEFVADRTRGRFFHKFINLDGQSGL